MHVDAAQKDRGPAARRAAKACVGELAIGRENTEVGRAGDDFASCERLISHHHLPPCVRSSSWEGTSKTLVAAPIELDRRSAFAALLRLKSFAVETSKRERGGAFKVTAHSHCRGGGVAGENCFGDGAMFGHRLNERLPRQRVANLSHDQR